MKVVFVHDLRERHRIEAELALSERLASMGRIASAVGHELNNPLTYVLGALEILESEVAAAACALPMAAKLAERVAVAREGAARVRDIVRDLQSLSRADRIEDAAAGCDLRRVLEIAAATAAHEVRHRARLVIEHADLPPVAASEGRLVQVFVNLLVNAAQAIPEGDVESNEIRVVAGREGEGVRVEVHDTGPGVPPGDAQRIFEPFFTTRSATNGVGLGLAIVQRIVSSIGGTIGVAPRAPRGSTFWLVLPVLDGAVHATDPPKPRRDVAPARILIVDDEPYIARVAATLLEPHDVVAVHGGRSAIDLLGRGERFDAIVCDLQMTDLGGADVYAWIVERRPELEARVGFMTGGAFTDRARCFLRDSRRPCLEKPFDAHALLALVDRLRGAREV